jgi:hypothetical protein
MLAGVVLLDESNIMCKNLIRKIASTIILNLQVVLFASRQIGCAAGAVGGRRYLLDRSPAHFEFSP